MGILKEEVFIDDWAQLVEKMNDIIKSNDQFEIHLSFKRFQELFGKGKLQTESIEKINCLVFWSDRSDHSKGVNLAPRVDHELIRKNGFLR